MDIKPIKPRRMITPGPQEAKLSQPATQPRLSGGAANVLLGTPPSKKSRRKWWVIGGIAALLAVIIIAAVGALWWYNDALQPRASSAQRVRVVIEPGSTPERIAGQLESSGIIKSALAFQLLLRQTGDRDKLKAGNYLLSPAQSSREVLDWLVSGKVDTFNITILPGQTLSQIKEKLIADGFKPADIDAAFTKTYDHPLLASKPASVNLEGYIYPETYQISSDTTVQNLLTHAFDEFYKQIQAKGIEAQLKAKGFTLHQGITLASIIQKEVSHDSDRRQVAQVFEKRLAEGIQLGSDVTFMYAAALTGQTASPSLDSPYNTRLYKGLPPGAIANFTLGSLLAVVNPAPGDYLYFVAGDDGATHFARTEAEHDANVKQYCSKLCFE